VVTLALLRIGDDMPIVVVARHDMPVDRSA
jgi:hypothetical protein